MVGDPVPHDDQWFKSIEVERRVGPVCRQLIVELLMARFAESEQLHVELRLGIDVHAGEENRSVGQGIPTVSVFQNGFVGEGTGWTLTCPDTGREAVRLHDMTMLKRLKLQQGTGEGQGDAGADENGGAGGAAFDAWESSAAVTVDRKSTRLNS